MGQKSVLTTWEAGRYCQVSPYTVRHWVRTGRLCAYTTPGGHRRIRRQDLDSFLMAHGMPLPTDFQEGAKRILMLMPDSHVLAAEMVAWSEALEPQAAASAFEAGLALATRDPHLFIVDLDAEGWDGLAICRRIHETPQTGHVPLAVVSKVATVEMLEQAQHSGVMVHFARPLDPEGIRRFLKRLFPYCPWNPAPK